MMTKKGTAFKLLFLHAFTALFCAFSGNQIASADLFDPEVYVLCTFGDCFSPQYGTSYCFDGQSKAPPKDSNPDLPYKTSILRGKLIAKTEFFAVFLMYKRFSVFKYFFSVPSDPECDSPFCSLEEVLDADPELRGIQEGDNLCVIPLNMYQRVRTTPSAVRAIETTDVFSGGLLDCSTRGGASGNVRDRYPYF